MITFTSSGFCTGIASSRTARSAIRPPVLPGPQSAGLLTAGMVLNERVSGRDEHALVVVTHMASPDHQFIAHIRLHRLPPPGALRDHARAIRLRRPGPKAGMTSGHRHQPGQDIPETT